MSNNQQNLGDIVQRRDTYAEDEIKVTKGVPAGSDPLAAINQATGLHMKMEDLTSTAQQSRPAQVEEKRPSGNLRALTPDEAAQLNETYERVDPNAQAFKDQIDHIDKLAADSANKTVDMLKESLAEEEAREARLGATLEDEDKRRELYQNDDSEEDDRKVTYSPTIGGDSAADPHQVANIQRTKIDSTSPVADTDDLVPAYDFEEDAAPPEAENTAEKRPTPDQTEEDYAEYLRGLETIKLGDKETDNSIVQTVRSRSNMTPVDSGRMSKSKIVGDQAFLNAINKYKKDNFRTVSVPLVNSGFTVDIVGTGEIDLTLLYSAVDQNTLAVDYELEKMRTVIRNVVGTNPKIDRNDLRNMIHFADYQLMAFAHISATLKDVELIHTCDECGKDFHIVCNSGDLILNMDELREKMHLIRNASTIQENSLMATDMKMTTTSGFAINLGHPSYSEYIQYLTEMKRLVTELPSTESTRLTTLTEILPFIRSIDMPNGVHTNSLYQRYLAVGLLSEDDYTEMTDAIASMRKKIITPRFGVKKVSCPHCHKVNTDISYRDLNDLLFFHITVTRLLKQTEKSSQNG